MDQCQRSHFQDRCFLACRSAGTSPWQTAPYPCSRKHDSRLRCCGAASTSPEKRKRMGTPTRQKWRHGSLPTLPMKQAGSNLLSGRRQSRLCSRWYAEHVTCYCVPGQEPAESTPKLEFWAPAHFCECGQVTNFLSFWFLVYKIKGLHCINSVILPSLKIYVQELIFAFSANTNFISEPFLIRSEFCFATVI